jgi:hypothetical protein
MTFLPLRALVAVAAASSATAFAYPAYLKSFSDHFEFNGVVVDDLVDQESCGICHNRAAGGGARNGYGKDFESKVLGAGAGYQVLDYLDSDSDGFLNVEEISAQTAPGKASVKPAGRIALARNGGDVSVTPVSSCQSLTLKAYGFQVDGKSDIALSNVAANSTSTFKLSGDKGLVLALCTKEGLVGSFFVE